MSHRDGDITALATMEHIGGEWCATCAMCAGTGKAYRASDLLDWLVVHLQVTHMAQPIEIPLIGQLKGVVKDDA